MVTREDVESFLLRLEEENVEEVESGMWVVTSDGASLVVNHTPPLLVLRTKVLEVPKEGSRCTELFRRLLELNASDLVYGAYGIEGNDVILTDSLELEHLDFDTFQSAIDSLQLALASHLETLSPYRDC